MTLKNLYMQVKIFNEIMNERLEKEVGIHKKTIKTDDAGFTFIFIV